MEMETVDLIASGHEWECPKCGELNKEVEVEEIVYCGKCGRAYEVNPPLNRDALTDEELYAIFLDTDPLCDCDRCFQNWREAWGPNIEKAKKHGRGDEHWFLIPSNC